MTDLKSLKFNAKVSKASIDRAKAFVEPLDNVANTIDFCIGNADNVSNRRSAACHGGISYHSIKSPDWVTTRISVWKDEDRNAFARFLTSPECYLSRFILNADTALEDRCVIVTSDIPTKVLHVINLLSRSTSEHKYASGYFQQVLKVIPDNPMLALIVSHQLSSDFKCKNVRTYFSGVHGKLLTTYSVENLRNFCNGTAVDGVFSKKPSTFRSGAKAYTGTSYMFGTGSSFDDFVKGLIADEKTGLREKLVSFRQNEKGLEASPVVNPFLKQASGFGGAPKEPYHLSREEFLEVFLPILSEEIKK